MFEAHGRNVLLQQKMYGSIYGVLLSVKIIKDDILMMRIVTKQYVMEAAIASMACYKSCKQIAWCRFKLFAFQSYLKGRAAKLNMT